MNNLRLSIIIPTYNRKDILKKCLTTIFNQTYPQNMYEIIVVDDGSTDGTEEMLKTMINDAPCNLRYFRQENKGPAAARNVGIRNANGKIVLFIGDDIIITPSLLEEHLKWHKEHTEDNIAVLGYITWSPEIEITPFMDWLENGGPQFHFWQIKDKVEVDAWRYFYTSNISLKKTFLLKNGLFDEDFKYAAYEDIELGSRLQKRGMLIRYNKNAIGYHYHPFNLNKYCNRMLYLGSSAVILSNKHPETYHFSLPKTSLVKRILKKCSYPVIRNLISFLDSFGIDFHSWYGKILDYYKFEGAKRAASI